MNVNVIDIILHETICTTNYDCILSISYYSIDFVCRMDSQERSIQSICQKYNL